MFLYMRLSTFLYQLFVIHNSTVDSIARTFNTGLTNMNNKQYILDGITVFIDNKSVSSNDWAIPDVYRLYNVLAHNSSATYVVIMHAVLRIIIWAAKQLRNYCIEAVCVCVCVYV